MRLCTDCGEPSIASQCPEHARERDSRKGSARARGYDAAWDRLSRRARRLQPFCSDCGTTEALTADHSPEAWRRKAAGLPIRLRDITVVCGPCNRARGAARGPKTRGDGVAPTDSGPAAQPRFQSLSTNGRGLRA